MTNLSAMRAIAELNKLQEVRNKEQAPQQKEVKNENKPNSIFDAFKKFSKQEVQKCIQNTSIVNKGDMWWTKDFKSTRPKKANIGTA